MQSFGDTMVVAELADTQGNCTPSSGAINISKFYSVQLNGRVERILLCDSAACDRCR